MFPVSAFRLKSPYNAVCKIINNVCPFFLGDRLSLFRDHGLQCSKLARVALVDIVLKEHKEEEICAV